MLKEGGLGVALVTGASEGIGKAAAQALANAGFQVFGTSRRASQAAPPGVTMLVCDVTSDESVKLLVKSVVARAGRIDVLVNNAGLSLIGGAEELSVGRAQDLLDVNVFGMLRLTNAVLPVMRSQGSGRIINMRPVAGFLPGPFAALCNSARKTVEDFSESLDQTLRGVGIRVVLIEPPCARTALADDKPSLIRRSVSATVEALP